jgi:hypothetical protein
LRSNYAAANVHPPRRIFIALESGEHSSYLRQLVQHAVEQNNGQKSLQLAFKTYIAAAAPPKNSPIQIYIGGRNRNKRSTLIARRLVTHPKQPYIGTHMHVPLKQSRSIRLLMSRQLYYLLNAHLSLK